MSYAEPVTRAPPSLQSMLLPLLILGLLGVIVYRMGLWGMAYFWAHWNARAPAKSRHHRYEPSDSEDSSESEESRSPSPEPRKRRGRKRR